LVTLTIERECERGKVNSIIRSIREWMNGLRSNASGFNFTNPLAQSANAVLQDVLWNQFHRQNFAKVYQYTQLEVMPNFYTLHSMLWASKISLNLRAQKLLLEWWWNQLQQQHGGEGWLQCWRNQDLMRRIWWLQAIFCNLVCTTRKEEKIK